MSVPYQKSRIFIQNVTVLDCAVWDVNSGPVGRSWNVDVEWYGSTDEEGVVIDFSAAKKLAKSIIDDLFDHRLFISDTVTSLESDGRIVCSPHHTTPFAQRFLIDTYGSSLVLFDQDLLIELSEGRTARLEDAISKEILSQSPSHVTQVKIKLREHHNRSQPFFFNYLHSLRLHRGNCQRFHGHSNIVEVYRDGQIDNESSASAARFLNGKYLVANCYLRDPEQETLQRLEKHINRAELNSDAFVWVSYEGSQGQVFVRVPRETLLLMNDESSIENISNWIHKHIFESAPSVEVHAYEGLNKGAVSS